MNTQQQTTFALDILVALVSRGEQTHFSYQGRVLLVDTALVAHSSEAWLTSMQEARSLYLLEKTGLAGADLVVLGSVWREALKQQDLLGEQLKQIGIKNLTVSSSATKGVLSRWRRLIDARLIAATPDLDYVEQLSLSDTHKNTSVLELAPLLQTWPERILNHPHWSCAESPLPEIQPLPLDDIWVDLNITEVFDETSRENTALPHLQEQRYNESQWMSIPADFIVESLKGTTVLVGAPGIGKTTFLKVGGTSCYSTGRRTLSVAFICTTAGLCPFQGTTA